MEEDRNITDLLDLTVEEITAQLPDLSIEQLDALHDAETAGKTRETLIDAIAQERDNRAANESGSDNPAAGPEPQAGADINAIAALSVNEIRKQVPDLTDDELDALKAAEHAGAKRAGVFKAVAAEVEKRVGDGDVAGEETKGKPKVPDYQKPEYSGPLTGEQAMWRKQHLQRES